MPPKENTFILTFTDDIHWQLDRWAWQDGFDQEGSFETDSSVKWYPIWKVYIYREVDSFEYEIEPWIGAEDKSKWYCDVKVIELFKELKFKQNPGCVNYNRRLKELKFKRDFSISQKFEIKHRNHDYLVFTEISGTCIYQQEIKTLLSLKRFINQLKKREDQYEIV